MDNQVTDPVNEAGGKHSSGPSSTRRAIFLDRDGTIIEDRGYLHHPSEVVFFPETMPALQQLQRAFLLFIVTQQSGISQGVLENAEVKRVNQSVVQRLAEFGIRIEQVYYCPHQKADGCPCIKPNPYFLQMAERKFGIDLKESFVIGDHPHDVELARRAGARGIYVLTGHGEHHRKELAADVIVTRNIAAAAQWATNSAVSQRQQTGFSTETSRAAGISGDGGVVAFPAETEQKTTKEQHGYASQNDTAARKGA